MRNPRSTRSNDINRLYPNSKPYTRWWWFSGAIEKSAIRSQLDWLRAYGFGGVEIAWVFPLPGSRRGPRWLSREWSSLVAYAKQYANRIGLGCDFTFGSLWPFGGSIVPRRDAAQTYRGLSAQRLRRSWESLHHAPGYILNHLDRRALDRYAEKMGRALLPALTSGPSALFCDSWEVDTDGLWTQGFDRCFRKAYGYSARGYMPKIDLFPDIRYDYRKLIADYVVNEFYAPFTRVCHQLGAYSRVQCHGAPVDLIAAYAAADIPETETILFDPHFAQFAASAATLARKKIVSAEAFTCLYGWKPYPGPGDHQGYERLTDIKLLADAMFANGVNMIVWHGMPYDSQQGKNRFYASVHVGPDSSFIDDLKEFNRYLRKVSSLLRQGQNYTDVAVYLPLEDNWMKNKLPKKLEKPSAQYHWELHYQMFPKESVPYRPTWITHDFLKHSRFNGKHLVYQNTRFSLLYIDSKYLDREALVNILKLAQAGLPVCMKRIPVEPGLNKHRDYQTMRRRLLELENVTRSMKTARHNPPLVESKTELDFWCRRQKDRATIFFSHPAARNLHYPMVYGHSFGNKNIAVPAVINIFQRAYQVRLVFKPGQAVICVIDRKHGVTYRDLSFVPGRK